MNTTDHSERTTSQEPKQREEASATGPRPGQTVRQWIAALARPHVPVAIATLQELATGGDSPRVQRSRGARPRARGRVQAANTLCRAASCSDKEIAQLAQTRLLGVAVSMENLAAHADPNLRASAQRTAARCRRLATTQARAPSPIPAGGMTQRGRDGAETRRDRGSAPEDCPRGTT
jgi:hypothetical protein